MIFIDHGCGNLFNFEAAIHHLGFTSIVKDSLQKNTPVSSPIIIPGVGSFAKARQNLKDRRLDDFLVQCHEEGRPILGVCLGFQLLFTHGHEGGQSKGLDWIQGEVVPLGAMHMGWAQINLRPLQKNPGLESLPAQPWVYFAHSFAVEDQPIDALSTTIEFAGKNVCCAVAKNQLLGLQFHPEKSGPAGLQIIERFLVT